MKFTIQREALLKPLQAVMGVVEKRHTMAILANVLFEISEQTLFITATDLEIELKAQAVLGGDVKTGSITIPGRKLLDIVKSLPDNALISLSVEKNQKIMITSGRSRFSLSGLVADDFPKVDGQLGDQQFSLPQGKLLTLFKQTAFAMAHQDVRYFLNGLLLELNEDSVRVVATDGHRLATSILNLTTHCQNHQLIIPRKAVMELMRLLNDNDEMVLVALGSNHIKVEMEGFVFTSKLLEGRYPDYNRVIPKESENVVLADLEPLRQALSRTSILSNEKYRGVRLHLTPGKIKLVANNPEHEEAQDEIEVDYDGQEMEIGFNVSYLLDVLQVIQGDTVRLSFANINSSALMRDQNDTKSLYVVMPIRL